MTAQWIEIDLREDPDEARYECDPGDLIDAASFVADMTRRPAWTARGSCRGQGADKWWPGRGVDVRPLKQVCEGCPVQAECRAEALSRPSHADGGGIWGGTSERERRQLRHSSVSEGGETSDGRPRCVDCGAPCTKTRCLDCHNAWALAQMPPPAA